MKILVQIGIVCALYWVSQVIEAVLPFSFPAGVISILLLLVLLAVKAIKLKNIQETADLLVGNLAFFLIPVSVGFMDYVGLLMENGVAFVVVCSVSLVLTFAATAWTVQLTTRLMNKKKKEEQE